MRKIKLELWVFGFGFWFCSERRVLGSPPKENAVILGTRIETLTNAAIFYFHRESYLMSNGIQAYENGDGACFLSSGALVHDSRDLFSEGRYSFICQSLESAYRCYHGNIIARKPLQHRFLSALKKRALWLSCFYRIMKIIPTWEGKHSLTTVSFSLQSFTKYQAQPSGGHAKTSLVVAQITSPLRTAVIRIRSDARA